NVFGGNQVFFSADAGQTWTNITNNLPNVPVWKIVIDPRTGALYVGTDQGVYTSTTNGATWSAFNTGLPNVQVRDMALNQTLNTLTIATYGRGVYQVFLDTTQANAGALISLSGEATWTGNITLAGPTTIGANGTQVLQTIQTGIAQASLNIVGTISDATP